ncbi:hypothetical protein BN12_2620028 [Nostocoides japonicum T1-X7]|uniref:Helicase domain protein n=1 Tax=Nostocoides japonicum T1-X7 TaxID=1194083 RepID=A0A077LW99_9MICO|nr:DEAD/DEAH box helicase [Tetrasphaera japonica]CCH78213.1 hypothetical protein BN12_2620028 [Tetrasphaera japonica T1-X7]
MPRLLTPWLRESLDNEFAGDWRRQRRTAEDILRRLQSQEGVVLADQVGMGKTFVALAVATSRILAQSTPGQVVILVPARVGEKWVREWGKFSESLLRDGAPELRCVPRAIRSGEDLLKAVDDPPRSRAHIVIVTYEALTASLKDSFIQLALLYYACRNRTGAATTRSLIARWCTGSSGLIRDSRLTTPRVAALLSTPPEEWRETWMDLTDGQDLGDDPVPAALCEVAAELDLASVWDILQTLPVKRSANLDVRLKAARKSLNDATQSVWKAVLVSARLRLPLLIVDEAHSLKNGHTRISRLFSPLPDAPEDGALTGIFDRILLLTATPFELGHSELINVLSRLDAIRPMRPKPAEALDVRLDRLREALQRAQVTALELDASWGRLSPADLADFDSWGLTAHPPTHLGAHGRRAWHDAQLAVKARTLMRQELRPWVIRHNRPVRRRYNQGAAILPGAEQTADPACSLPVAGLKIPEDSVLPFLLAARAQAVAEHHGGVARPLFAYGIASSYEAFLRLEDGADNLDSDVETGASDDMADDPESPHAEVHWYRKEIQSILRDEDSRARHPKVAATTERALELWCAGEKCLVFCWYIKTTAALHSALSLKVDLLIRARASESLGIPVDRVDEELERISNRLLRADSGNYERIKTDLIDSFVTAAGRLTIDDAEDEAMSGRELAEAVADVAIRSLRTPACLVRYTNLRVDLGADDLWRGISGTNPSGVNLLARWVQFVERLAGATALERRTVLDALLGDQGDDSSDASGRGARLSTVRRAYGQTRREDRERLITVFNTPFAPDILVASSVMGEGIDLHQECRHVIHHDLDWNPSRLEQRTGRLDRIGALAERVSKDIEVYEPFLADTHDEKMFRVVKDRAGWFDIVMGRAIGTDERETDAEEKRVPLHPLIQEALSMDLRGPG